MSLRGVTALIPGSGIAGALIRNVVTEGISIVEDIITRKEVNVVDTMVNIALGTVLDSSFEKISDKVVGAIKSKSPKNYSSYANYARKSNPNMTKEQIYRSMQRSIRFNRVATNAVSYGFDVFRTVLPY